MPSPFRRLTWGQKDFLRVMGLGLGYIPSALIPSRFDPWIIDHLTALALRLRPGKEERLKERMSRTLGARAQDRDLTADTRAQYQLSLEGPWARVRSLHKRGWKPKVSIDGMERLQKARAAGAGTILWRMSFGSSLTVKIGLWRAGIPLVHLSIVHHGAWSGAWIAKRALCPLYRRTEKWYLDERVIIPKSGASGGAMKTLLRRLTKDNAVVSIIGDTRSGTQNITTPFLDWQAQFPTGSPSLAWKTGSALLPVYAVRERTGRYRIVIDEPISVDRDLDRKVYVKRAVEEFSERMQDAIATYPGSWADWGGFWARGAVYLDPSKVPPRPSLSAGA